jgi:hypothetical protein
VQVLVELDSADSGSLLLRKRVVCSPTQPPPPDALGPLELALRTAAGPRRVQLAADTGLRPTTAARACGFVPTEEALRAELDEAVFVPEIPAIRVVVDLFGQVPDPWRW